MRLKLTYSKVESQNCSGVTPPDPRFRGRGGIGRGREGEGWGGDGRGGEVLSGHCQFILQLALMLILVFLSTAKKSFVLYRSFNAVFNKNSAFSKDSANKY